MRRISGSEGLYAGQTCQLYKRDARASYKRENTESTASQE